MTTGSSLRKRKGTSSDSKSARVADAATSDDPKVHSEVSGRSLPDPEYKYQIGLFFVSALAFVTRFYSINYPDEVVFDEVHFGKFASYYLERTYFFDLHPPFAKLLIAFAGWLIGYDGSFKYDKIGDSYIENSVPYIALRALSAIQGSITVPIVFLTLKECNFKVLSCLLGSFIILFDNAHVAETRLILLDATLNFTVALSIYCYVRFSKERKAPFSLNWWLWLSASGLSLSLVISTKYVGVFTFLMIGVAVLIELWDILDYKKGHTLEYFSKHFFARVWCLIVVPFMLYLFWFYVHFAVLVKSGPGDPFMSPAFQETLADSPLARDAKEIYYYDSLTLKHKGTNAFLHTEDAHYPLRYEDGRVSSQGQIVSAKPNDEFDSNNYWQILPDKDTKYGSNVPVKLGDVFRLYHPGTQSFLLAHDVASPFYPTNEEFTTIPAEEAEGDRYEFTLFKTDSFDGKNGKPMKTRGSIFKILHVKTMVAMWSHNDKLLPEWGSGLQEVNGNKKIAEDSNLWFFNTLVGLAEDDPRRVYIPKKVKTMNFFSKWIELQRLMFYHNNKLSSEHPFASSPETWPFSLSGVSFWTKNDDKKQIYFIGNIVGYWIEVAMIALYLGVLLADQLTIRRNFHPLSNASRDRLYYTIGFFFVGWCTHYFPFFLMSRQKFLHHYMPAHLIAAELTGAVFELLFTDNRGPDLLTAEEKKQKNKNKNKTTMKFGYVFAFFVLVCAIVWCFVFFSPLTYGNVSLTPDEVIKRKWLSITLHFAK